jgi:Fe-S oxidoreductase
MPDLRTSLSYCTYCPKLCRHACPVSNAEPSEALVPQAKMAGLRWLRTEARAEERTTEATLPLYGCTGCGACTAACAHGVEVAAALGVGREEARRERRAHPALTGFVARFQARGEKVLARLRATLAGPREPAPAPAPVAFVPACDDPEAAGPFGELWARAGNGPLAVALLPHGCAGYPLLEAGEQDAFRLHAERTAQALAGYERVVVDCPACAVTLKTRYREFGVPLAARIENTVEHLAALLDRLPAGAPERPDAFYHDPCHLGRHQGLYDEPRRVAARVVGAVHEFSRARADAECSGGGGLLPLTMPETAREIAGRRLEEAREAGARTVITACPRCRKQFSAAGIEALDLLRLLHAQSQPEKR